MFGLTQNRNIFMPQNQTPGTRLNLEDLRKQLTTRIAILILISAQIGILFYDPPVQFPLDMLLFWASLTLLCLSILKLTDGKPVLARRLLTWGMLFELVIAMLLFPISWFPYLGAVLIFTNGILVGGSEWITAVTIGIIAVTFTLNEHRDYELAGIMVVLTLSVISTWLAVRTLYTTLDWVWHMNQRANELLLTTRDQQAELKSTIKSLQLVNNIREQTERELLIAHKQLRQAQRLKEQFAANISHELRTPLSIILGFSEVMYLSPDVYGPMEWPQKLLRDVYQIYRNSRHLLGMIDDILDLSRFEMVGFTLSKERVQLTPFLQETAIIINDLFDSKPEISLQISIPPNMPDIEIDPTRIRQVLLNLLNNARRYTETGTVTLTVETAVDEVIIHVQDTGSGIPEELLPNIFTEFYQVDYSMSRAHGGAGLGLAICHRFVEAHDGRIWVESEVGVGSTFSFSLPLPSHKPVAKSYRTRPIEPTIEEEEERPYIVLIDPDPIVVSLVQRYLEDFEVLPVANPTELKEQIKTYHPLAAIYNLPPNETVEKSWETEIGIPTIECSLPSQAWLADALGAVACLTKPISFDHLRHEIEELGTIHNILIIDDNPGICQLLERGLSSMNPDFNVQIAYDGQLGIAAMQAQHPDLVLLDLMMPNLDGNGVRDLMRADDTLADIPVILLTATTYIEDTLAQYGSQVKIVQASPWHPGETLQILDAILKNIKHHPILENGQ